jgi:Glycosyl transferase family 11
MGGLGNQMFQYAAARRLALRTGDELALDLGWFDHEGREWVTQRRFELGVFHLPARRVSFPPRAIEAWERGGAARVLRFRRLRLAVLRNEGAGPADARVLAASRDVLLIGYWQSERYFADAADTIRADFAFRKPPSQEYSQVLRSIESNSAVAVHVRRGDYASDSRTNAIHGTLEPSYYREAIARVAERVGALHVFVFSDDPDWAAEHLAFEHPVTHVSRAGSHAVDELYLMTLCGHHVIANSSFSWWGAWLCDTPNRIVIAPRRWFRDDRIDTAELVPSRWIRI